MSIKINISEILTKTWQIIWKFKVLWIFGILSGCGGSNGGRFNFNFNGGGGGNGTGGSEQVPEFFQQFLDRFKQFENMQPEQAVQGLLGQYGGIIAAVILLLCVLWIVFYFLGIMGKTGLIKGASKADGGAETLTFGELWTESMPYFWRMFGLNMLIGLPFFILIVILIAGLGLAGYSSFASGMTGVGLGAMFVGMLGVFFAMICIISIASIIVSMVMEQAQNAIVIEDMGVLEGLSRGWNIFKSAVLTIIVLAIILGVLGGVVGMLIALPLILIIVMAGFSMVATGGNSYILPLIIGGGCFVIYLPALLVIGGVLQAYTQSAWTLAYRRLTALPAWVGPGSSTGAVNNIDGSAITK